MNKETRERELGIFTLGLHLSRAKKYLIDHKRTRESWVLHYQNEDFNLIISLDLFFCQRCYIYCEPGKYLSAEQLFEIVSNKDSKLYDPEIVNALLFNLHTLKKLR